MLSSDIENVCHVSRRIESMLYTLVEWTVQNWTCLFLRILRVLMKDQIQGRLWGAVYIGLVQTASGAQWKCFHQRDTWLEQGEFNVQWIMYAWWISFTYCPHVFLVRIKNSALLYCMEGVCTIEKSACYKPTISELRGMFSSELRISCAKSGVAGNARIPKGSYPVMCQTRKCRSPDTWHVTSVFMQPWFCHYSISKTQQIQKLPRCSMQDFFTKFETSLQPCSTSCALVDDLPG